MWIGIRVCSPYARPIHILEEVTTSNYNPLNSTPDSSNSTLVVGIDVDILIEIRKGARSCTKHPCPILCLMTR